MKKPIFCGVATALVTPFSNTYKIDYKALENLIKMQINGAIDALVILGSTGEKSTLSIKEHKTVLEFASEIVNKRVPIIAGTGSNDIGVAVDMTKFAEKLGYDGALVVTPYYNKSTQAGIVKSYFKIADNVNFPIILYNVPQRTGINIEPETYFELSKHPNINGIKEANGNIDKILKTMALVKGELNLYSGNDSQILPILSCGGKGVISVLSNIDIKRAKNITDNFFEGNLKAALDAQLAVNELIEALFVEVNPIPVKYCLYKMGLIKNVLRLPLVKLSRKNQIKIDKILKSLR